MKRIKQHRNKQKADGVYDKSLFRHFKRFYSGLNKAEKTKLNKEKLGKEQL